MPFIINTDVTTQPFPSFRKVSTKTQLGLSLTSRQTWHQIISYSLLCPVLLWNMDWDSWSWSEGSSIMCFFFFFLVVSNLIECLWYGQTIMLRQTDSLCPQHAGLMVWSLWPIYFVCIAGKLDSLFPDDSYIDMGEIDVGRKVAQQIPPGIFWRSQVFIDHPMYLKFNVSLSKDALVGIYGRRGLPPSHTQVRNTTRTARHFNYTSKRLCFRCCSMNVCVIFLLIKFNMACN